MKYKVNHMMDKRQYVIKELMVPGFIEQAGNHIVKGRSYDF